jgi:hypothetical protein
VDRRIRAVARRRIDLLGRSGVMRERARDI